MKLLLSLGLVYLAGSSFAFAAWKVDVAAKSAIKADQEVPFEVTVKDEKGKPVAGAAVTVVATMVEMDHGEFKYEAKPSKPGVYTFSPKFMMGGAWNLAIKAAKGSESGALSRKIEVQD